MLVMTFSVPKPPMIFPAWSNWVYGAKARTRALIAVQEALPRQLDCGRPNISRIGYQVAEMAFQTQSPGLQVGIAKMGRCN